MRRRARLAWRWLQVVWRWLAHHQFLAALVLIGGVVAGAFWRDHYLAERDRAHTACLSSWADQFTDRAAKLTAANTVRSDALDKVLRDVFDQVSTGRNDQNAFRERLAEYIAASDTYTLRLEQNPIPAPPRIRC